MSGPRGARPPRPGPEVPGRLSPDQPVWEVDGEQCLAEQGAADQPRRELVPDTLGPAGITVTPSSPPAPGSRPVPVSRPAPGRPSQWGRRLLVAVLAVGLFAGGIALGSVLAGGRGEPARPASAARPSAAPSSAAPGSAPPTTAAPARQVASPACLSAVDDADAVISYLVTNMRDQRLARTLEQYREASRACRRAR
jgi:hypothetical protein